MNEREGLLVRNEIGRFEFSDIELTSGSLVEICIDEHWILGVVEHWRDDYYWFSQQNGVTVILQSGIKARLPWWKGRRVTK